MKVNPDSDQRNYLTFMSPLELQSPVGWPSEIHIVSRGSAGT